jgi:hypothetical protein
VLKRGGRIAYFTIFIANDVAEATRREIRRVGAPGVYSRAEQTALLRSAGFTRITETDVSKEYRRVQQALYDANARHERAMRKVLGDSEFEGRQQTRRQNVAWIASGAVRRSLLVAERAGQGRT